MDFLRATSEQIDAIEDVVVQCREDLAALNIIQWDDQYPNRAFFEQSLAADHLFVLIEAGEAVGVVVLNDDEAPEWSPVVWQDRVGSALIVHSLAVLPSSQGKGYGKAILSFCETFARDQGYTSMRLDAFPENVAAVRFYERQGYTFRGEIELLNKPIGHQCYHCYEKRLIPLPLPLKPDMPTITVETYIQVPIETCFDLARDIGLHCRTAAHSQERAVAGVTTGLIGLGEEVTFEAVHFGIRQRLTSRITEFDRPHRFVDEMQQGAFQELEHLHEFRTEGTGTVMKDTLIWTAPFGLLGKLADRLFLESHMRHFLIERNAQLKQIAETERAE